MSKKTIIDWQRDSIIVAVGHSSGGAVTIDRVSEQTIGHAPNHAINKQGKDAGESGDDILPLNGDAAQGLVRAINELDLRRSEATVIVSRDLAEVRTISIPHIDPAELPDVIRFQAQRQLANMTDAWTLDYVLLPNAPGQEMLTALVGAISPATMHEIDTACEQAGVTATQVMLRPIEIARFVVASGKLPGGDPALVLCISDQDADLLILEQGRVIQVRNTKLPGEAAHLKTTLSGELRRSMMAASVQLGNRPIQRALLIAVPEISSAVSELVATLLDCNVSLIDPSELLSTAISERRSLASRAASRLAAIAGSFSLASAAVNAQLDFKNPKKRPPPQKNTRTYILAAAAVVLLALGGLTWWFSVNRQLDDQLALLQAEMESSKGSIVDAQARIAQVKEIDYFLQGSANWLEELVYIAEKIPPADKVLLGEPIFSTASDDKGRITMAVGFDSPSTIGKFESSLSDASHVFAPRNSTQLVADPTDLYKWQVDEQITVSGRGWNLIPQLDTSRNAGQSPPTPTKAPEVTQPATDAASGTPEEAAAKADTVPSSTINSAT